MKKISILIILGLFLFATIVLAQDRPSVPNQNYEDTTKEKSLVDQVYSSVKSGYNNISNFIDVLQLLLAYANFFLACIIFFGVITLTIWGPLQIWDYIKKYGKRVEKLWKLSSI